MSDILKELDEVLKTRKGAEPESSYVASLYNKGLNKILEKLGEEATETLLAAKDGEAKNIVYETADLWFHTLVMLHHLGLSSEDVINELGRRFGLSGLEEKANRKS